MGRKLKRVPLDFSWPPGTTWYGYLSRLCAESCEECREFARIKGLPLLSHNCPDYEPLIGPPKGDGYQLWETTSEGSPVSPVFASLDGLCEWCEENATTFGSHRAGRDEWRLMLEADSVHSREGDVSFM